VWSIVFAVVGFIIISTLLGVYYYLGGVQEDSKNALAAIYSPTIEKQAENYNQQLKALNKDLNLAQYYVSGKLQWGSFLKDVQDLKTKENVKITHLQVSQEGKGQLSALGKDRNQVISFKNLFAGIKGISSVDLPLQTIQETSGGISFLLNFSFNPNLIGTK